MTPQQPIGQQQKVGVGGQGSLGSTWSDPSVNISLDFLSAGLNPTKTPPTLNNIIQQQGIMFHPVIHFLFAFYTACGCFSSKNEKSLEFSFKSKMNFSSLLRKVKFKL